MVRRGGEELEEKGEREEEKEEGEEEEEGSKEKAHIVKWKDVVAPHKV